MEAHARAARAQLQRAGSAAATSGDAVDDGGVRKDHTKFCVTAIWEHHCAPQLFLVDTSR